MSHLVTPQLLWFVLFCQKSQVCGSLLVPHLHGHANCGSVFPLEAKWNDGQGSS